MQGHSVTRVILDMNLAYIIKSPRWVTLCTCDEADAGGHRRRRLCFCPPTKTIQVRNLKSKMNIM